MNTTELIGKLDHMRADHGDIQVMPPAFDESGFF